MGAVVVAVGEGVSALLVEARCAAEPEPALEPGVWAEAEKAAQATATARRMIFMRIKLK